jgi:hypothetical protein
MENMQYRHHFHTSSSPSKNLTTVNPGVKVSYEYLTFSLSGFAWLVDRWPFCIRLSAFFLPFWL